MAAAVMSGLQETLSPDEKVRSLAYRFARDQKHFIVGRGILRSILARYLRRASEEVEFSYGPTGKPHLTLRGETDNVCFNLSHSDDLMLVAVALNRDVGVDVERIRADMDVLPIAESFFPPDEVAMLRGLSFEKRIHRFYELWTAKEACLKACGASLANDLARVRVSANSDGPEIAIAGSPDEWCLHVFMCERGFSSALVTKGRPQEVNLWLWDETLANMKCNSWSLAPDSSDLQSPSHLIC